MSEATITVEMGETHVSQAVEGRLVAHGLGACLGLCLYDSVARLAAMVHIVLPETVPLRSFGNSVQGYVPLPGRCADTAVTHVVEEIIRHGARADRLRAALAGGAQIFTHSSPSGSLSCLEIGPRNVQAVRSALESKRIPVIGDDVGGSYGRHFSLCLQTGEVFVQRIGSDEWLLASLGQIEGLSGERKEEVLGFGR